MTTEALEEVVEAARRLADRTTNARLADILRSVADDLERLVEEAKRVEPQGDQR